MTKRERLSAKVEAAAAALADALAHVEAAKRLAEEPERGALAWAACDLAATGRKLDRMLKVLNRGKPDGPTE